MKKKETITIERTIPERGYESKEYPIQEAISVLNTEIENNRTIFIDGRPLLNQVVTEGDLQKCRREVSVTNQLIGG